VDVYGFVVDVLSWSAALRLGFPVVSAWMVAGAALLLVGWATLPRHPPPTGPGRPGHWTPSVGRAAGGALIAVVASALAFVAVSLVADPLSVAARMAGLPRGSVVVAGIGAAPFGAMAGWLSRRSHWTRSGVVTWLGLALMSFGFVGYAALIAASSVGAFGVVVASVLAVLEAFGLFLMLAYQFYALERIAGREAPVRPPGAPSDATLPYVAVQVAAYNEPTSLVRECLDSVRGLDYPVGRWRVQLLDDSTDPNSVAALSQYCRDHGIDFLHRTHRRGFKAGALNDGERALPPEVELVAIVDADYIVDRRFLRSTVGAFLDPAVVFLQTPQGYRNVAGSGFGRAYGLADAYFYHVVQPVRARFQSAIFCGTMGIVRRSALRNIGGWSEPCVTEDAEASLRLLAAGGKGVYSLDACGWGMAPVTMEGVRSQHRRWARGGVQMLRMNRGLFTPAHLAWRQRVDFRVGGLFWTDGFFVLGMATTLTSIAIGAWFGLALSSPSATALALAAAAPMLLLGDGFLKVRLALRPARSPGYGDVVRIVAFWYALKLNDLRAALRGWFGSPGAFTRTPKSTPEPQGRWASLRATVGATPVKLGLALGLVGVAAAGMLRPIVLPATAIAVPQLVLLAWIGCYALAFLAAPVADYRSRRRPAPLPVGSAAPARRSPTSVSPPAA
jgi:cellulose synthase/poly-beta-1,6-N-acetylglucosamine synthase-like glycosyltransferase